MYYTGVLLVQMVFEKFLKHFKSPHPDQSSKCHVLHMRLNEGLILTWGRKWYFWPSGCSRAEISLRPEKSEYYTSMMSTFYNKKHAFRISLPKAVHYKSETVLFVNVSLFLNKQSLNGKSKSLLKWFV